MENHSAAPVSSSWNSIVLIKNQGAKEILWWIPSYTTCLAIQLSSGIEGRSSRVEDWPCTRMLFSDLPTTAKPNHLFPSTRVPFRSKKRWNMSLFPAVPVRLPVSVPRHRFKK
ncbi:hypothetical protein RvY_18768-4 [Ramazzottius varieornatus]|uniref:Uncharacterized protein n=1 Tax=Ramazzottius varieornatus TaxID=947166 RepID=A0A1D1W6Z5_RAMVA|nr:hypothetical protein RvY_18768-4 [Ramazzottius varieornatus]